MASFYAVPGTGENAGATGYLVANGNVYPAASGGDLRMIPQGDYTYGGAEPLNKDQYETMTNGDDPKKFRKFHIWGTGPGTPIWDPILKRKREGIEFHYDGQNAGTHGCIGYQDNAAKDALIADKAKNVHVEYLNNEQEVQAAIEKQLGHKVDWSKVQKPRPIGAPDPGQISNTKKGNVVKVGDASVLAGDQARQTAHIQAQLTSGQLVAEGSKTVFVGPQQRPVSGVDHMTEDGSPIATGENSVLFT